MNKVKIPSGTWPVMITPFKSDGSVDYDAIEPLVEFYLDAGVAGLFACCGSSEILELTADEIVSISSTVIEIVNGRVSVVSGAILFDEMPVQIEFAKAIASTGPEAVIVAPTQFVKEDESDDLLFERLKYFTNAIDTDITLGVYEYPRPYQRIIPNDIFAWLIDTGRYVFFKDTCCDIDLIKVRLDMLRLTDMAHFNANNPTLLESLRYGSNGYCGTAANFCPELYCWLCDNYSLQPKLAEFVAHCGIKYNETTDICDNYPANSKAYLKIIGIEMEEYCRINVPDVTDKHRQLLRQLSLDFAKFKKITLGMQECMV